MDFANPQPDATAAAIVPLAARRNFCWMIAGNLVYGACLWGMLVVLAKQGSEETVGQFAFALAITAPIILPWMSSLRMLQVTNPAERRLADYLRARLAVQAVAIVLIGLIVLAIQPAWQTAAVIGAIAVAKCLDGLGDACHALFQRRERMDFIALSLSLNGLLSLGGLWLGMMLTGNVVWAAVGSALASGLTLVCHDAPRAAALADQTVSKHNCEQPAICQTHWVNMRVLLWVAAPLAFAGTLTSLNPYIPRYFIENYWGVAELGVFAALAYVAVAGNALITALAQTMLPRLSRMLAAGECGEFRRLLGRLLAFGCVAGLAAVGLAGLLGRPFLSLIYRAQYAEFADVFLWLTVAMALGFLVFFLDLAISAARFFTIQAPINVAVLAVCLCGSALLIPRHGLLGAAWTQCLVLLPAVILKGLAVLHACRPADVTLARGALEAKQS